VPRRKGTARKKPSPEWRLLSEVTAAWAVDVVKNPEHVAALRRRGLQAKEERRRGLMRCPACLLVKGAPLPGFVCGLTRCPRRFVLLGPSVGQQPAVRVEGWGNIMERAVIAELQRDVANLIRKRRARLKKLDLAVPVVKPEERRNRAIEDCKKLIDEMRQEDLTYDISENQPPKSGPTRVLLMEKRSHLEKWIRKIDEMITSLRDL
jgi:hypothetical protein